MSRLVGAVLALAAGAALAGCRTPLSVGADYDPAVPFGQPATFAWDDADARPAGDIRLEKNPFFAARLHGAIQDQLERRGIRLDGAAPELLVHYHASVRDRVEVLQADQQSGYTSSAYGPGTQVYQYEEGTFLIDVADADTRRIVWRGWARVDLAGALDDPKLLAELVGQAVAGMFERFPVPVGSAPAPEAPPAPEPLPPDNPFEPEPDAEPWPDWPSQG